MSTTEDTQTTQPTDRPAEGRITTKVAAVAIAAAAAVGVVAGAVGSSTTSVSTADHEATLASQHDDLMHRWAADVAAPPASASNLNDFLVYTPGMKYATETWRIDTSSIPGDADREPSSTTTWVHVDDERLKGNIQFCGPDTHLDPRVKKATGMSGPTNTAFFRGPTDTDSARLQMERMPGWTEVGYWAMPPHLAKHEFNVCLPD